MELREAVQIVKNQRILVIPLVVISFFVSCIMVFQMDTNYQSHSSITLINTSQQNTHNPYLEFDQSLQTTAQVVSETMSNDATRESLENKGLSTDYEVSVPYDPTRTVLLPVIDIVVTASTPEAAKQTSQALIDATQDELSRKQTESGAPRDSWIQAFPSGNTKATPISGSKVRTFLIVFGLGTATAIMAAFVVDGYQQGSSKNREKKTIVLDSVTQTKKTTDQDKQADNQKKSAPSKIARKPVKRPVGSTTRKPRTAPKSSSKDSAST